MTGGSLRLVLGDQLTRGLSALADLDPREAASLVLEYDNPTLNKTYLIEAGDLYAANAFLDYTATRNQR